MSNDLHLEISDKYIDEGASTIIGKNAAMMITPPLNEEYWIFRVKLHEDQAIVGFPKFGTIGIGFALETDNWNTNLPYTCDDEMIYNHIEHNKKYDEITKEQCVQAIHLIQEAAKRYQQSRGVIHGQ